MTVAAFQKFKGSLYFWCSPCRAAHDQGVNLLWLEGSEPVGEGQRCDGPKNHERGEDADTCPTDDHKRESRQVGVR